MAKRILILNGHPAATSLSKQFAEIYAESARAGGFDTKLIHIRELEFDSDFGFGGYTQTKPLESDLEQLLVDMEWSEHLVLLTPMWWGGVPAKLKGLFDRILLPGRTFDTRKKVGGFPVPMLAGRTARVILTSDTPSWYFRLFYKSALWIQLKHQILSFVGFKPTKLTHLNMASHPSGTQVRAWKRTVQSFAEKGI